MNRLVIVGNGFDLAHGLPTGYCDFIDTYWSNVFMIFKNPYQYIFNYKDELIRFDFDVFNLPIRILEDFRKIETHLDYTKFVEKCSELSIDTEGFNDIDFTKNSFFQIINNRHHIQNWVDIENEYYKLLKKCLEEEDNVKVSQLNKEFWQVRKLLEEYLDNNISKKFDFETPNDDYQELLKIFLIKPLHLKGNPNHEYFNEFQKEDHTALIELDNKIVTSSNDSRLQGDIDNTVIVQDTLILNFNYTPTFDAYLNLMSKKRGCRRDVAFGITYQIQIHGQLNSPYNPINFGFGDEMDDDYKIIEKKDDNEYLRNIKSFQYLQNSNYRDMLDFIDSDKFQVYVMGHSCGLSDRILLNKIFEHHNCRSIKVFYHQFDEPKVDGRTDNYTEIVQNISRHFNKKEMMREKIVNKSLCQPLPQNVRFAKK